MEEYIDTTSFNKIEILSIIKKTPLKKVLPKMGNMNILNNDLKTILLSHYMSSNSNTNLIRTIDQGLIKMSVREFDMCVYDFLERNKDRLCEVYELDSYNPTDMKKEYIKWCKDNEYPRLVEPIHKRPWFLACFLSEYKHKLEWKWI